MLDEQKISIESDNDEKLALIQQEVAQFGAAQTQIVHDLKSADWALAKLRKLNREQAAEAKMVDEKIAEYKDWLEKQNKRRDGFRDMLERDLTAYTSTERAKNPKYRLSTPNGVVSYTHHKAAVSWADEKATLDWLEKQQDEALKPALKLKPILNKTVFKKMLKLVGDRAVTENGEVVPGVGVNPEHDSVSIKPTEDEEVTE